MCCRRSGRSSKRTTELGTNRSTAPTIRDHRWELLVGLRAVLAVHQALADLDPRLALRSGGLDQRGLPPILFLVSHPWTPCRATSWPAGAGSGPTGPARSECRRIPCWGRGEGIAEWVRRSVPCPAPPTPSTRSASRRTRTLPAALCAETTSRAPTAAGGPPRSVSMWTTSSPGLFLFLPRFEHISGLGP